MPSLVDKVRVWMNNEHQSGLAIANERVRKGATLATFSIGSEHGPTEKEEAWEQSWPHSLPPSERFILATGNVGPSSFLSIMEPTPSSLAFYANHAMPSKATAKLVIRYDNENGLYTARLVARKDLAPGKRVTFPYSEGAIFPKKKRKLSCRPVRQKKRQLSRDTSGQFVGSKRPIVRDQIPPRSKSTGKFVISKKPCHMHNQVQLNREQRASNRAARHQTE